MAKCFDDVSAEALGSIDGGLVLDVGTGRGGNLDRLSKHLLRWKSIVAVDLDPESLARAREIQQQDGIVMTVSDASALPFRDESYDTVAMSASMHHMKDCAAVLQEMLRVLRPGGAVIVTEMCRDNETEAQGTMMLLHDWAGEIDTDRGINHGPTKTRAEIRSLVESMDLVSVVVRDFGDPESDPQDEAFVAAGLEAISRYLTRLEGLPRRAEYEQRGEALRQRLAQVGIQSQPGVHVVGRKRTI